MSHTGQMFIDLDAMKRQIDRQVKRAQLLGSVALLASALGGALVATIVQRRTK